MSEREKNQINTVRAVGLSLVNRIVSEEAAINNLSLTAKSLANSLVSVEEAYSWLSVVLAIQAAAANNFGVGAVLVDPQGAVVEMAGNQVFSPRFDSAGHAEMLVMNDFEKSHPEWASLRDYSLYTSL